MFKHLVTAGLILNLAIFNFLIFRPLPIKAQPSLENIGNSATKILNWFQQLVTQINKIADAEDRKRLASSLTVLNKKIYDLEQDSRYLLIALERPNPKKDEIVEAVSDARESLIALKSELEQIGFEVRKLTGVNEPNIELRTMNAIGIREAALDEIDILEREIT